MTTSGGFSFWTRKLVGDDDVCSRQARSQTLPGSFKCGAGVNRCASCEKVFIFASSLGDLFFLFSWLKNKIKNDNIIETNVNNVPLTVISLVD